MPHIEIKFSIVEFVELRGRVISYDATLTSEADDAQRSARQDTRLRD